MAARIHRNLYAVQSLDPITQGVGNVELYCCLPLDLGPNGTLTSHTRYCSLLVAPPPISGSDLLVTFERERAFASRWITFLWEVE